ncbi:hypothetical protein B0H17DRAFT_1146247 [Mycena rosella]|uniref:Uncharacterized protein n=1 Tax=Mycena rosella TaxID=1033263 RepID=A0AAD7CQ14_MYCRO|nr:hypothetical protein B0H17DRAFT_1146247 [Mycena rosella]
MCRPSTSIHGSARPSQALLVQLEARPSHVECPGFLEAVSKKRNCSKVKHLVRKAGAVQEFQGLVADGPRPPIMSVLAGNIPVGVPRSNRGQAVLKDGTIFFSVQFGSGNPSFESGSGREDSGRHVLLHREKILAESQFSLVADGPHPPIIQGVNRIPVGSLVRLEARPYRKMYFLGEKERCESKTHPER